MANDTFFVHNNNTNQQQQQQQQELSQENNESSYKCPHCEFFYTSNSLLPNLTGFGNNQCPHLLIDYTSVSTVNATYRSASNLTATMLGTTKIPLVIAKRFIRYIRDRNYNTPPGFYTIHQIKSRISNTFQGITSFSIKKTIQESNLQDEKKEILIESSYYLTSNPIVDASQFESFIVKNYIDTDISSLFSINQFINNNDMMNNNSNNSSSDTNIIDSNSNNSSNNNSSLYYIAFNQDQLKTLFLEDDDQDLNFNSRWMVIFLPNQLPLFIFISNNLTTTESDKVFFGPLQISDSLVSNIKTLPIIHLPDVAVQ
ncbi:hypothetical protein CYY_007151 [Polysphondylium violaceum]|uniref:Uncharacterized protein n=1 Tax=Polysphondylium violaceum TaxID=133409 RepID=A0A8J4PRD0_9MYCE|nr:hypothetical protein CYY_007151 [Polysphondylium violaceum]